MRYPIGRTQGDRNYDATYARAAEERHMSGQHADRADPDCPVCKRERR
jgi:ribosomal protein L37AE/L43A